MIGKHLVVVKEVTPSSHNFTICGLKKPREILPTIFFALSRHHCPPTTMIFTTACTLLLANVAAANIVAMAAGATVITTGGRRRGGGRATAATAATGAMAMPTLAGVDPAYICLQTGLIKSWKGATDEDTEILRQLINTGMLDGLRTQEIKDQYPRFNRFTSKCLGDKVSNLRRTLRDNIERRNEMDGDNGGGQGLPA